MRKIDKSKLAKTWGQWIREHPQTPALLQKLMDTAMTDGDDNQWTAIKMLVDRIAPHLKAVEMDVKGEITQGVIVLPEKKVREVQQGRGEANSIMVKEVGAEA
ncbi:uncharacterized protein METZ01_LOCUS511168 [marine metagenome]|uniref:Uncharacterized protein n=1 Tax=marine metagenome TaxID=408172 RepID=A0A383EP03_9ZZZZ